MTETINGLVIQAPRAFTGTLAGNYIYTAIYNMIIGQRVFSDNIKGLYNDLVDHFRTEGSMFGDRKLFYATDGLTTAPWGADAEAANLLNIKRNTEVSCQEVVINQYRIIDLTTDNYLSKKAWADEGTFNKFNSTLLQWIRDTKRIFESKLMNVHVGTVKGAANINKKSITFESGATGKADIEAQNRLNAQKIAQGIADLFDEMKDASRDYNDYKYMRSYDPSDLYIVYNAKFANEITKVDLPSLFHKDGLEPSFATKLPAKYFGVIVNSTNVSNYAASTATTGKPLAGSAAPYAYTPGTNNANGKVCTLVECDVKISNVNYHLFPGDELPATTSVVASGAAGASGQVNLGEIYIVDDTVICKIMHKDSIPYMSGFETSSEFFNQRSLTSNHYLIWGYSELTYLKNYPMIEIKKA